LLAHIIVRGINLASFDAETMSVWEQKKKPQSMLWGRSDLAEKFYSGEKASNPWVRDLLWKKNITDEHKKFGDDPSPIDLVPPHMRSVVVANVNASMEQKEKRRRKREFLNQSLGREQQRPNTSQSYREYALQESARQSPYRYSARSSARSHSGKRTNRSSSGVKVPPLPPLENYSRSPSARSLKSNYSVGSLNSTATLGQFTQLLHHQNSKLEEDLRLQQQERTRLENKIADLENLVRTSVVKSSASQYRTEKRLAAYKIIVDKLAAAQERRQNRGNLPGKRM